MPIIRTVPTHILPLGISVIRVSNYYSVYGGYVGQNNNQRGSPIRLVYSRLIIQMWVMDGKLRLHITPLGRMS
jgi:hypothetical protein